MGGGGGGGKRFLLVVIGRFLRGYVCLVIYLFSNLIFEYLLGIRYCVGFIEISEVGFLFTRGV